VLGCFARPCERPAPRAHQVARARMAVATASSDSVRVRHIAIEFFLVMSGTFLSRKRISIA
jgi:hypothetical protein